MEKKILLLLLLGCTLTFTATGQPGSVSTEFSPGNWGTELVVARYFSGLETDVFENARQEQLELFIYPNPTSDFLNFQLRPLRPAASSFFQIVDVNGVILQKIEPKTPGALQAVPLRDWPGGIYFLQYVEEGTVRASERFLVIK